MSFKRKQESVAFSVPVTPDKRKKLDAEDEDIVAVLAPFNPFPKVLFSCIKLNETSTRIVTLRNPTKTAIHVELKKLPETPRGFQWSFTECELPSESETKLTVSWTPLQYGSWRDSVKITNKRNNKNISEIILISSTEDEPVIPRRCLRSRPQTNIQGNKPLQRARASTSKLIASKKNIENKENITTVQPSKKPSNERIVQNKTLVQTIKDVNESQPSSIIKSKGQQDIKGAEIFKGQYAAVSATVTANNTIDKITAHPSPRRTTFEVSAPAALSRRSTYLLRNKQLENVAELENERRSFESLASPGICNDRFEIAASNLAEEDTGEDPRPSIAGNSTTDAELSSLTYIIPTTQAAVREEVDCIPSRHTTFEVPASSVSVEPYVVANRLPEKWNTARYSLDSLCDSENLQDSLENTSPVLSKAESLLDLSRFDFDNVFISSQTDNNGERQELPADLSEEIDAVNFDFSSMKSEGTLLQENEALDHLDFNVTTESWSSETVGDQSSKPSTSQLSELGNTDQIVILNKTYTQINIESMDESSHSVFNKLDLNSTDSQTKSAHPLISVKKEKQLRIKTENLQETGVSSVLYVDDTSATNAELVENVNFQLLISVKKEKELGRKTTENLQETGVSSATNAELVENVNFQPFISVKKEKEIRRVTTENLQEREVSSVLLIDDTSATNAELVENVNFQPFISVKKEKEIRRVTTENLQEKEVSSVLKVDDTSAANAELVETVNFESGLTKVKLLKADETLDVQQRPCQSVTNFTASSPQLGFDHSHQIGDANISNVMESSICSESQTIGSLSLKHKPLVFDISPPKNIEYSPDQQNKSETRKTLPSKFGTKTCALSLNAIKNILPLKNKISLKENITNSCSKLSSRKNQLSKNENLKGSSENLFVVPTAVGTKRPSQMLPKTSNLSPPKVRKMTPEVKVKRLTTPSTCRKPTMNSLTDCQKKGSKEMSRTAPRFSSGNKRKSLKVTDWLPVRRLRLSASQSDGESFSSAPVTPMDPSTPDPFLAATTLNPFSKGGLYLSEEWLKNQEQELIEWADRMLRPPSELQLDRDQSTRSTLHRLNTLRAKACALLFSDKVATVLSKIKVAVDRKMICIRKDKQLHADLGLQQKVISLLMSYNPLWLRLCLETVYQCDVPLKRHSDSAGLVNFIRRRVISDDFIEDTYSHPTIPYLKLPEFEDKIKKFTFYKFLMLVYLLDIVKCKKVILHDPCLFLKESEYKSSKEILIEFNKEFVAGSGDITKVLRLKGYEVFHSQTYLDEFDFALNNRSELRDGVRLTKLAEILVGDNSLCSRLRVPAISSLQKKFNAEIAITALKNAGFDIPNDVSPKDISDGHSEKTLSFLWHLRGIIQMHSVKLIINKWRETKLLRQDRQKFLNIRSSVIKIQKWYRRIKEKRMCSSEDVQKAKQERDNFLRLRSAVIFVQCKFREKMAKQDRKRKWKAAVIIQKWYKAHFKAKNNKYLLKNMRSAAVVIQTKFRAYLVANKERKNYQQIKCAVLVIQRRFRACVIAKKEKENYLQMKYAVKIIQRKYRAHLITKKERQNYQQIKSAVVIIQRRFKAHLIAKKERGNYLKIKSSVVVIQKRFRARLLAVKERQNYLQMRSAAVIIQRRFRARLIAEKKRQNYLQMRSAVLIIQRRFRACLITKKKRENYLQMRSAAVIIQKRFRGRIIAMKEKQNYLQMRSAAVIIQRRFRACLIAKHEREDYLQMRSAAVIIQRRFRACLIAKHKRENYLQMRSSAVIIQRRFRACLIAKHKRENYLQMRSAAVIIQRRFRACLIAKHERENYLQMRSAAVIIQRRFRGRIIAMKERQNYLQMRSAAVIIQRRFRACLIAKHERENYLQMRSAAVIIQRRFRACLIAKHEREDYLQMRSAAVIIQRRFRACLIAKHKRENYLQMRSSAVIIQRRFRACLIAKHKRENYLQMRSAAVIIQRRFRGRIIAMKERQNYLQMRSAAVIIQRRFRGRIIAMKERQNYLQMRSAAVIIQRRFRACLIAKHERENYLQMRSAAVIIQRRFRACLIANHKRENYLQMRSAAVIIQRRFRACLIAKHERENYLQMRSAAVIIQRRFRACLIAKHKRENYLQMRSAAVIIQRRFRECLIAKKKRENYLQMRSAAVIIQRRFRACLIAKKKRENYLQMRSAAVIIQRKFRARLIAVKERQNYLQMRSAAVIIQKRFRARRIAVKERENYLKIRSAAVIIQRRFRSCLIAKHTRENYLQMRSAAVIIQRRFRECLIAKKERENYQQMRSAAVIIQKRFRARLLAVKERQNYLQMRSAAVIIQRRFRECLIAKKERENYQQMRSAAVIIQKRFRARLLAVKERQNYLQMRSAAVIIQRRFRECLIAKKERENYLQMRSAAVIIQKRFRECLIAKKERENYLQMRSAAVIIQKRFRECLITKKERENYLQMRSAVVIIQKRFRARLIAVKERQNYLQMRSAAVIIQRISRAYLVRKAEEKHQNTVPAITLKARRNAAIKIQAVWRGFMVRRKVVVPPSLLQPNDPKKFRQPIANRGNNVLQVLSNFRSHSVGGLQLVLYNLDSITVLSPDQCSYFANNGTVKILYTFMGCSNKTLGVDRCVELAILIILNLYKAPTTAEVVWQDTLEANGIVQLLDLMISFRTEKTSTVFCKAATLLWMFARDPAKAVEIMNIPNVSKTLKYIIKNMPKQKQPGASTSKTTPKPAQTKRRLPAVVPNWGNYFHHPRAFDNKEFALECVTKLLNLS